MSAPIRSRRHSQLRRVFQALTIALSAFANVEALAAAEAVDTPPDLASCLWGDAADALVARLAVSYEQAGSGVWRERSYLRVWQRGVVGDGTEVVSSVIMLGLAPAAARQVGYLRWQFPATARREPDEWVFVPRLQKVRRATVRDAEDMVMRDIEDDLGLVAPSFRLVGTLAPAAADTTTSWLGLLEIDAPVRWRGRWWVTVERDAFAEPCRVVAMEQRDAKERRVRGLDMQWRKVTGRWIRAQVFVSDIPSEQRVGYHFTAVQTNAALPANLFNPQTLRALPRTFHEQGWLGNDEP